MAQLWSGVHNNDNNEHNYYLAYRKNKQNWQCFLTRPFLINIYNNIITGQYISSLWFNDKFGVNDILDLVILQLSNNDNINNSYILSRLSESDTYNIPLNDLDIVTMHKRYSINELQNIIDTLNETVIENKNYSTCELYSLVSRGLKFGMRFTKIINEDYKYISLVDNGKTKKDNDNEETNISYLISCPIFEINLY